MKLLGFFFFFIFFSNVKTATWPKNVSAGLLFNQLNKIFYHTAASDAINQLKYDEIIPKDFNFSLHIKEGCDDSTAMTGAVQLWKEHNISALFGPECATGLNVVSLFASNINVPVFSFTPMPSDLENKTKFNSLIHVAFDYSQTYQAIYAVLKFYNWTRIGIVKASPICTTLMSAATSFFAQRQIQYADMTLDVTKNDSVTLALNILQNVTRVMLVCSGLNPIDALPFLTIVDKMGMLTPDYVYILPIFQKDDFVTWDHWLDSSASEEKRNLMKKLFMFTLIVQIEVGTVNQIQKFNNTMNLIAANSTELSNTNQTSSLNSDLKKLSVFRDSVYLYGIAMNKSISHNTPTSDLSIIDACSSIEFNGASGQVIINDRIERLPEFTVLQLFETWTPILRLGSKSKFNSSYEIEVISKVNEPQWHTPNNSVPKAYPPCGFGTIKCADNSATRNDNGSTVAIVTALATLLICVSTAVGVYFYRKRLFEQRVYKMAWKIDLTQLRLVAKGESLQSIVKSDKNFSCAQFSLTNSFGSFIKEGKYELYGYYNNRMVAVKRWKKMAGLNLTRDHLILLKSLKDISNENLNPFIGLVVDDGPAVIAIWNHCAKGSLDDIIFNDDIQLDIMFKVSILRDIISGLEYLHSSIVGYHGKLHLSNCLVDSKWVIKLTDFGLESLVDYMKHNKIIRIADISPSSERLLLLAPELLRNFNTTNKKAADLYSFGMAAYQILYRTSPFYNLKMEVEDVVAHIRRGDYSPPRPTLKPLKGCNSNLLYIINNCWHEIPLRRPTASAVKQEIFRSTKDFSKNLMDHVMSMLSKYATNLERIVAEKSERLNDERKRYDALLYQMLPRTVADSLTAGIPVDPESFDCVTICFYSIVGFNPLCLISTPNQLISTLNRLYSQIDYIISSFNAYKVETINGNYCLVNGLPIKNGNDHACNIADFSLRIKQLFDSFVVCHQPSYKLRSRIGIHSGPAVCGVIGLAIPRFYLFGESVNVASKMERTGDVGNVHISEDTKSLLDMYSTYEIQRRKPVEYQPNSYWLLSKK